MPYRKGERTARMRERELPHHVAIEVPPSGLGNRLLAMYAWREVFGEAETGRWRREGERDFMVWCFPSAEVADAFAEAFGGRRL